NDLIMVAACLAGPPTFIRVSARKTRLVTTSPLDTRASCRAPLRQPRTALPASVQPLATSRPETDCLLAPRSHPLRAGHPGRPPVCPHRPRATATDRFESRSLARRLPSPLGRLDRTLRTTLVQSGIRRRLTRREQAEHHPRTRACERAH